MTEEHRSAGKDVQAARKAQLLALITGKRAQQNGGERPSTDSNYELMKKQMERQILHYDLRGAAGKFGLKTDEDYLYLRFVSRDYRLDLHSGAVEWTTDGFASVHPAAYNDAMTIFDVLGYSKPDCRLSGSFCNMQSLSTMHTASAQSAFGMFLGVAKEFDAHPQALIRACRALGGTEGGPNAKGDISFVLPLFDFLPVQLQFWQSDEEFPPVLQLYCDRNMLDFMHYETVWFAMSHLRSRVREEMAA